ncbi:SOSS complex subunit C homolog [Pollicipes pollicipes]|uniref:SOSS complex subunit C homolog n=1 Tax=Pollicipes pollicipes TaxID=41117 RepID=UPI001884F3BD|nr:SOSS complex subunit C homolog [Pollicipes pollicipes]
MSASTRQAIENRKILEDLQAQKKQLLLKPGAVPFASGTPGTPAGVTTSGDHLLSPAQRQALQQANSTSFGYFVPQDSLFGNLVMPVIPRLEVGGARKDK